MLEAFSGHMVKLGAKESQLRTSLLCGLASILDFNAWEPELEVEAEAEMPREGLPVDGPSAEEDVLACVPVVLNPLLALLVEVAFIAVELLL